MSEPDRQRRYTANLQGEVDGAALYRTLSQSEKNPELARVYARLAAVEEAHAEFWRGRLRAIGRNFGALRPGFRTRAQTRFGDAERWPELMQGYAFGRAATPEEIAAMAAFLASNRSGYPTGSIVTIDGGGGSRRSAI